MPNLELEKETNERYTSLVNDIILFRFRIVVFCGMFMYLLFNLLDQVVYPSQALLFLKIRCVCSTILLICFCLSFLKKLKPLAVWFLDTVVMATGLGIILMVHLADGSSSHYYEGLHLVILGMGMTNAIFTRHNIFSVLLILGFYELAVLTNGTHFNIINFLSANFFMISIYFFVILMSHLYSVQHRQGFLRQEQLDQLSKTDELTKIHNRRSFFNLLQEKIAASEKSNKSFYLIIFDLDYFKDLNDRWGHAFGDLALQKVVDIVKKNIRADDCVGRFGGDEFILYLDFPDADMLMNRLTKISQGVTSLNLKQQNKSVLISISIGAAKFIPQHNITKESLLEKADQQLLLVKKTNRGQIGIAE